ETMAVYVGSSAERGIWIAASNYVAWRLASARVAWMILGGWMAKGSMEPLLWLLFSAGGVLAALLLPILLLLFGLAIPLDWVPAPGFDPLGRVLHHPLTPVVPFLLGTRSLF